MVNSMRFGGPLRGCFPWKALAPLFVCISAADVVAPRSADAPCLDLIAALYVATKLTLIGVPSTLQQGWYFPIEVFI